MERGGRMAPKGGRGKGKGDKKKKDEKGLDCGCREKIYFELLFCCH